MKKSKIKKKMVEVYRFCASELMIFNLATSKDRNNHELYFIFVGFMCFLDFLKFSQKMVEKLGWKATAFEAGMAFLGTGLWEALWTFQMDCRRMSSAVVGLEVFHGLRTIQEFALVGTQREAASAG